MKGLGKEQTTHLVKFLKDRAAVKAVALPVRLGRVLQHQVRRAQVDSVNQEFAVRDRQGKFEGSGVLFRDVGRAPDDEGRGQFLKAVRKDWNLSESIDTLTF